MFWCKAFVYVEPRYRKKLDAKAVEGIFLGYTTNANAYVVAVPNNRGGKRLVQTRSTTFDAGQPIFTGPTSLEIETIAGATILMMIVRMELQNPYFYQDQFLRVQMGMVLQEKVIRLYKELTMCNWRCCKS